MFYITYIIYIIHDIMTKIIVTIVGITSRHFLFQMIVDKQ